MSLPKHLTSAIAMLMLSAAIIHGRAVAAEPDPVAGKATFGRACGVCHAVEAGRTKVGPTMFGVVGRAAAAVPNYSYSDAMRDTHWIWDAVHLDTYLENPREAVPGTKMIYPGLAASDQRADLIAYLQTLK